MATGINFKKHQICICSITVGKVNYPRPCVILDVASNGVLAILPISTKQYNNACMFNVDETHPDFPATGLDVTSYIFDSPIRDAAPSDILKIVGELSGDLKAQFVDWIGD